MLRTVRAMLSRLLQAPQNREQMPRLALELSVLVAAVNAAEESLAHLLQVRLPRWQHRQSTRRLHLQPRVTGADCSCAHSPSHSARTRAWALMLVPPLSKPPKPPSLRPSRLKKSPHP